ncbi:MAG TPA: hypothetical protein VF405_01815 [Gammaproteobacteria bacterium]
MEYNVAYTVYRSCVNAVTRALANAMATGQLPSQDVLDDEAKAVVQLNKARENLLEAMRLEG